jgi:dTDP-glucose 4,6-dehydratase
LPVVISRCSNNYGSYQHPEKFIPMMITNAILGKTLPIYGTGKNVRDWIHVIDHCRALDTILHYGKHGEVYNAGGNSEAQNNDVVEFIVTYLGVSKDMLEFVRDRPGHDLRYAMDYSKINRELGWKPLVDFEQGLTDTIEWYKDNRDWWEPLKN